MEDAMNTGAIGRNDLTFHEGMLIPIASELRKLKPLGFAKLTRPKALRQGIKDALRNVSYFEKN